MPPNGAVHVVATKHSRSEDSERARAGSPFTHTVQRQGVVPRIHRTFLDHGS